MKPISLSSIPARSRSRPLSGTMTPARQRRSVLLPAAVRAGDDGGFAWGEGDPEIAEGASPAEADGQPSSFQDGVTHDG